jgi:hypothetical protein
MVDAMLELMPTAQVWHLGLFRDERTLRPVEYYNNLPASASVDLCLILDPKLWDQTIQIATTYKVLKAAPSADATRTDLAQKALDALGSSVDTKGANFKKGTVTLNEKGN